MSDDSKYTGNGKNEKKTELKVPSRNWLLWILILGCIPLLMVFKNNKDAHYVQISRQDLVALVNNNQQRGECANRRAKAQTPRNAIRQSRRDERKRQVQQMRDGADAWLWREADNRADTRVRPVGARQPLDQDPVVQREWRMDIVKVHVGSRPV